MVHSHHRKTNALAGLALGLILFAATTSHAVSDHSTPITMTPDFSEVWVVNPDHGTVGVIPTTGAGTHSLVAEIAVGAEPWCIDIHPSNGEAWVTSMAENRIYIIDTATRSVLTTIDDLGFETYGVSFNPAGTVALVTATGSDEIFAVDVATRTVTHTLPSYRRPRGIAWRADGARAWITHLMMPEFIGRLTTVFTSTMTTSEILMNQIFGLDDAGYPSTMQGITLAPAPYDDYVWIPNNAINTTTGGLIANPLTPANIFHALISPVNVTSSTHTALDAHFLSKPPGTPVGGPIAVDFKGSRGYIANLHSNDVTVMNTNIINNPIEVANIPVGQAPFGVVANPNAVQVYVANWLSRDVSVIGNGSLTVLTTVPSTNTEVLPPQILNGKRWFFSSEPPAAINDVGACASCHIFGTSDSRPWDLSQFGKHIRTTPDIRGIGWTGAHDWTGDKDEMEDHEFGILEFTGGVGFLAGSANAPLGAPNSGLNQDLDDLGSFMATLKHRDTTPFMDPGGQLTADALLGKAIFENPAVGCATCHSGPFFTDSRLEAPFIKHDVGTADPSDTDAAGGFDTPSLVGLWDTGPYLHHGLAYTLQQVLTTFNPSDEHGVTSTLTSTELDQLVAYLQQIAHPAGSGSPVDAPEVLGSVHGAFGRNFPNPFNARTSLQFSLEEHAADVTIDVYDVAGRHVRSLLAQGMARGGHTIGWDSRDAQGSEVAPGTYFARLVVNGELSGTQKMTVLR